MIIHEENIEQLMFEYFEGDLSQQEKEEVLNYIHQNPSYEKDFVQWAQSYAHIGEAAPDYGLRKSLIKSKPAVLISTKVYWSMVPIGLLILFFWYNWSDAPIQKLESAKDKRNVRSLPENRIDTVMRSPIQKRPIPYPLVFEKPTSSRTDRVDFAPLSLEDSVIQSVKEEKPQVADSAKIFEVEVLPKISAALDTAHNVVDSPQKATPTKKTLPKKKWKHPLNLKADPEFIPQNPNF